jgi:glycerol-3-phosphate dehydrogenase
MSDRILHEIEKNQKIYGIDNEIGPSKSKGMKISGNIFESEEEMENFILSMIEKHPPYKKFIRNLFFKYGSNIEQIIEYADQHNIENNPTAEVAINYGEIKYAVEKEMVHTLSDFCIRRTGMLYFEPVQMMYELDQYADHMQEICEWDDQKKAEEIQLVKLAHKTALDFN